jgi:hypothetical protein
MTRHSETGPGTTDLGRDGPAPPTHPSRAQPPRDRPPHGQAAPTQTLPPPAPTRKINLTAAQVGASAGASATSAVGASFLGAGGTIAGAAVGAVITTVAGALYTRSLESAGSRLRDTTTVLVKRLPSDGVRATSVPSHLGDVTDPDAGEPAGETTVVTPAEPATPEEAGTLERAGEAARQRRRPWILVAIAAAGFALAVFGISAVESLLGHPVSGGSGGTSVGRVIGTEPDTSGDQRPTTPPSTEPSPQESATTGDGPTAEPSTSSEPSSEPSSEASTPAGEPTAEPSQEPSSEASTGADEQEAPAAAP